METKFSQILAIPSLFITKAYPELALSYKSRASSNTSPDTTDANGEVRTRWDDFWDGKTIEVFCDGVYQREITLSKSRRIPEIHLELNRYGCFPAETQVLTPTGLRAIASIKVGERVLSFQGLGDTLCEQEVIHVFCHPPAQLYAVELANGQRFSVTGGHRFLTDHGFVSIDQLHPGDTLKQATQAPQAITNIYAENTPAPVYNLVTSGDFNFIVAGCIAHNFIRHPKSQMYFWRMVHALQKTPRLFAPKPETVKVAS